MNEGRSLLDCQEIHPLYNLDYDGSYSFNSSVSFFLQGMCFLCRDGVTSHTCVIAIKGSMLKCAFVLSRDTAAGDKRPVLA